MLSTDDIKEAARPLLKSYGFNGATLFGSFARGNPTENSDVDIFVLVPEGTKTKWVLEFAYDLGEKLGVEVDAYGSHEVPSGSKLLDQIIMYGVKL